MCQTRQSHTMSLLVSGIDQIHCQPAGLPFSCCILVLLIDTPQLSPELGLLGG